MIVLRDSSNVFVQKRRAAQTTGPQLPVAPTGLRQQGQIELGTSGRKQQGDQLPAALMAQITSGPLNSPYRRAFIRLPSSIQSSLWDQGYSRIQPDGELLKESLEIEQTTSLWTTSLGARILEKCIEYNDLTNEIEVPKCPTPERQLRNTII